MRSIVPLGQSIEQERRRTEFTFLRCLQEMEDPCELHVSFFSKWGENSWSSVRCASIFTSFTRHHIGNRDQINAEKTVWIFRQERFFSEDGNEI